MEAILSSPWFAVIAALILGLLSIGPFQDINAIRTAAFVVLCIICAVIAITCGIAWMWQFVLGFLVMAVVGLIAVLLSS